jgi:competence ComEA-like helix-hairpin-helix protein
VNNFIKASSLIPINQATVIDLQSLHGIGPKRAERIVRYREEVSDIGNIHDLATATGMSLKQAGPLSQLVEWASPQPAFRIIATPILTIAGSFLLVLYGFSELHFNVTSLSKLLYNLSLLMIMVGCTSLTAEQLLFHISNRHRIFRPLAILSITAFLSGIVSLLSLVCITVILDLSPDLTIQMTATTNFLIFVFVIIYLINAPGIHLRRNNLYHEANSKNINIAAMLFDYGHLILGGLVFVMLTVFNSGLGIEEIFAIWASVLLASSGFEMARGRSAYISLLLEHEKETLQFIHSVDEEENSFDRNLKLMKIAGILLIVIAALLFSLALYQLRSTN